MFGTPTGVAGPLTRDFRGFIRYLKIDPEIIPVYVNFIL